MLSKPEQPTLAHILEQSAFEPTVPDLFKKSAFFINTVGMREVPERLVIELFREVSFESLRPSDTPKASDLLPNETDSVEETALLHIARGRGKRKKGSVNRPNYFGPLYPELARNTWPRKQTERVIAYQFLDRPLAQHVADAHVSTTTFASNIVSALTGRVRPSDGTADVFREILDRIQIDRAASGLLDEAQAIAKLSERLEAAKGMILDSGTPDPLAARIALDFQSLCRIEGRIPRLLWIDHLKCYLRLALPTWLLAHMRLTVHLRDWTLQAMGGSVLEDGQIAIAVQERWKGLFHPTQTGSNEIALHIERYVKARVELSIATYWIRAILGPDAINGSLSLRSIGSGRITISDWLGRCRMAGSQIGLACDPSVVRAKIVPVAQRFGAWLSPAAKGQGKNIEEFLRILLRLQDSDDDEGYLLTGSGFQRPIVFPGPAMLRTMLQLAAEKKRGTIGHARGKVILSDLEDHFAEYGVDFAASVGARPQLISELSRLGLLKGSPDAGDSAELIAPEFT